MDVLEDAVRALIQYHVPLLSRCDAYFFEMYHEPEFAHHIESCQRVTTSFGWDRLQICTEHNKVIFWVVPSIHSYPSVSMSHGPGQFILYYADLYQSVELVHQRLKNASGLDQFLLPELQNMVWEFVAYLPR